MRSFAHVFLACMLGSASGVSAQVYRWIDDSGRVIYGNVPPPGAAGTLQLELRTVPAEAIVRAPSNSPPARPREFPAAARVAPSAFPGTVDHATVASLGRTLRVRACERRPAHCSDAPTVALASAALAPLSALHAP